VGRRRGLHATLLDRHLHVRLREQLVHARQKRLVARVTLMPIAIAHLPTPILIGA
jgi:hypothetical protein